MAIPILSRKGETAVLDKECVESQVASHSNRGLHGVICLHPGNHKQGLLPGTQPGFEIGANECAICPLAEHGLTT